MLLVIVIMAIICIIIVIILFRSPNKPKCAYCYHDCYYVHMHLIGSVYLLVSCARL